MQQPLLETPLLELEYRMCMPLWALYSFVTAAGLDYVIIDSSPSDLLPALPRSPHQTRVQSRDPIGGHEKWILCQTVEDRDVVGYKSVQGLSKSCQDVIEMGEESETTGRVWEVHR